MANVKTKTKVETLVRSDPRIKPDWKRACDVCGERPIMPITGMCGPCTTGESDTIGGNW